MITVGVCLEDENVCWAACGRYVTEASSGVAREGRKNTQTDAVAYEDRHGEGGAQRKQPCRTLGANLVDPQEAKSSEKGDAHGERAERRRKQQVSIHFFAFF